MSPVQPAIAALDPQARAALVRALAALILEAERERAALAALRSDR